MKGELEGKGKEGEGSMSACHGESHALSTSPTANDPTSPPNTNNPPRSPSRIPSHRAQAPLRCRPDTQTLPHAPIRAEHCRRQVPFLVLPQEAPQGQEDQRRDRIPERGVSPPTYTHPEEHDINNP